MTLKHHREKQQQPAGGKDKCQAAQTTVQPPAPDDECGSVAHSQHCVITSYSIHYTKLYDPIFNAFYKKYRSKGLEIVYINNDGKNVGEVKTFAHELGIDFPVVYDPEGIIAKQYNVRVQPLTMILSPESYNFV